MITLRLDSKLEQTIENTAKHLGLTKSELIRRSIQEYLNKVSSQTPWDLGKDLFGKYASGINNLSVDRKQILKKKIRSKLNEKNTD
jgi:hypothetical protein